MTKYLGPDRQLYGIQFSNFHFSWTYRMSDTEIVHAQWKQEQLMFFIKSLYDGQFMTTFAIVSVILYIGLTMNTNRACWMKTASL